MFFTLHLLFHVAFSSKSSTDETTIDFSQINYINYTDPGTYTFVLPSGRYKVSCYGAQGGWSYASSNFGNIGGKGAFVSAYINVTGHNTTFYAIVGGKGGSNPTGVSAGGYNGGGVSGWCKRWKHHLHHKQRNNGPGGGGGSTELRIEKNDISNRIIVAAGGSGASYNIEGAPGGNITGFNHFGPSDRTTQTNGNANGLGSNGDKAKRYPSSGGGGGYRGGSYGYAQNGDPAIAVADSGSSYISGFQGCEPNSNMIMDTGEMIVGTKEENGYFQIDQVYECPENCISCSGDHQCKICDAQYRLYNGLCYSECPIGSIDRSTYCEKCDSSCKSCSEIITNCNSCFDGFYHYNDKCISKCPTSTLIYGSECLKSCPLGTFTKGQNCIDCDISCKECTDDPNKCSDCPSGKYLFNNECIDGCPERTVRDGNKCVTECRPDQFLYDDVCLSKCPKGTFKKGIICEKCQSHCAECFGDADTCTRCSDNMHLLNAKCLDKCPDDYVTYHNVCIVECPSDTLINGAECVDHCPKGKFNVKGICTDCDSSCAACENTATSCTMCSKSTYLYDHQCLNECPNGTFIHQNECVLKCPSGSYLSGNTCTDALEYYGVNEIVKKEPFVSKDTSIVTITLLAIFGAGSTVVLVLLILDKFLCIRK